MGSDRVLSVSAMTTTITERGGERERERESKELEIERGIVIVKTEVATNFKFVGFLQIAVRIQDIDLDMPNSRATQKHKTS